MTIVRPFADLWPGIQNVFQELRPDLLEEVKNFGSRSPSELAQWLDQKFPIGVTWGTLPAMSVPHLLREHLEAQR
jgi:hypothetical protein